MATTIWDSLTCETVPGWSGSSGWLVCGEANGVAGTEGVGVDGRRVGIRRGGEGEESPGAVAGARGDEMQLGESDAGGLQLSPSLPTQQRLSRSFLRC